MNNVRTYGRPPFRVAVVHGGPGAPGEMAPVAREIAKTRGVLEPLQIASTRLSRLTEEERAAAELLSETLDDPASTNKNRVFAELGDYISRADSFDPLPSDSARIDCQYAVYQNVWRDAQEMRTSGRLLDLGRRIRCPVLAIHGDYDPHPAEGVKTPLSCVLKDFAFILLENCGHRPWLERAASDKFYSILEEQLG